MIKHFRIENKPILPNDSDQNDKNEKNSCSGNSDSPEHGKFCRYDPHPRIEMKDMNFFYVPSSRVNEWEKYKERLIIRGS